MERIQKRSLIIVGLILLLLGFGIRFALIREGYKTQPTPIVDQDHTTVDKSFLIGQPCEPPCWYNLIIGQSTVEDVLDSLKTQTFIVENSIREIPTKLGNDAGIVIRYDCVYIQGNSCGSLYMVDNVLVLNVMQIAFPLSLGDVVDKLGRPDYIDIYFYGNNCEGEFLWYKHGIKAINSAKHEEGLCKNEDAKQGLFDSDILITTLWYIAKDRFQACDESSCISWSGFID